MGIILKVLESEIGLISIEIEITDTKETMLLYTYIINLLVKKL